MPVQVRGVCFREKHKTVAVVQSKEIFFWSVYYSSITQALFVVETMRDVTIENWLLITIGSLLYAICINLKKRVKVRLVFRWTGDKNLHEIPTKKLKQLLVSIFPMQDIHNIYL